MEDDAKAFLQRRVAELEQANAQMKSELEHSSEAFAMLQSSYDEKNKFCEGLTKRNITLHKEIEDARSRV
jgi:prefoldin subunit 5